MDERVTLLLHQTGPTLAIDIGALTQNAILAKPGLDSENWPRFSVPSPALLVAQRIRELALLKKNLWLYGHEMGGGFINALREFMNLGLKASSTKSAAKSIHDNVQTVMDMGVEITEECPKGHIPVYLADYNPHFWATMLRISGLPQPHLVISTAQDHGGNGGSSRLIRMQNWQNLLNNDNDPINWIFEEVPENFQRLTTLHRLTGGPVADSASSAILGALCDSDFLSRCYRQGVTLINVGNSHTLAALIYKGKVLGIYEHHTNKRAMDLLLEDIEQFRLNWLPTEQVHASGGQGVAYAKQEAAAGGFEPTFILGPKRQLLKDKGSFLTPKGGMLFAGCYGLLYGWARGHAQV